MNVKSEEIGNHTIKVTLGVEESDYQELVTKELKKLRKTEQVHGFRVGNAPMRMIESKYGLQVKIDQVNQVISNSINEHIEGLKRVALLRPFLPKDQAPIDFLNEPSFEIAFIVMLRPQIDFAFIDGADVISYDIEIEDQQIDQQVDKMMEAFSQWEDAEAIEEENYLVWTKCSVGEETIKEMLPVHLQDASASKMKTHFMGAKINDTIVFNLFEELEQDFDKLLEFLKLKREDLAEEQLTSVKGDLTFTITNVRKVVTPELTDEFVKERVSERFNDPDLKTVADVRSHFKKSLKEAYQEVSDLFIYTQVADYLQANDLCKLDDKILREYMDDQMKEQHEHHHDHDHAEEEEIHEGEEHTCSCGHDHKPMTDEEYQENRKKVYSDILIAQAVETWKLEVKEEDVNKAIRRHYLQVTNANLLEIEYYLSFMIQSLKQNREQLMFYYDAALQYLAALYIKENMKVTPQKATWKEFSDIRTAHEEKKQ